MLKLSPDERLNLHGCLRHAWFAESIDQCLHPPETAMPASLLASPRVSPRAAQDGREGKTCGAVVKITCSMGSAVDDLKMVLRDKTMLAYGDPGGESFSETLLGGDEQIVAVMQETRQEQYKYIGNAIVFYTSLGQTVAFLGAEARKRARFAAPSDSQIVGLQFQGSLLTGIHLKDISEGGVLEKISARLGSSVDMITFHLRNGFSRVYPPCGSAGGKEQGPWLLAEGEFIIAVEQVCREGYLGRSVALYTSEGQIIALKGVEAAGFNSFAAPRHTQICGLGFQDGDLVTVSTCSSAGDLSQRVVHRVKD